MVKLKPGASIYTLHLIESTRARIVRGEHAATQVPEPVKSAAHRVPEGFARSCVQRYAIASASRAPRCMDATNRLRKSVAVRTVRNVRRISITAALRTSKSTAGAAPANFRVPPSGSASGKGPHEGASDFSHGRAAMPGSTVTTHMQNGARPSAGALVGPKSHINAVRRMRLSSVPRLHKALAAVSGVASLAAFSSTAKPGAMAPNRRVCNGE